MTFDPNRDVRRWRVITLLSAIGLMGVWLLVGLSEWTPGWQRIQSRERGPDGRGPALSAGILQQADNVGGIERCITCHRSSEHPAKWAGHLNRGAGCTTCHGGDGRALSAQAAHALPGTEKPDPILRAPHGQAGCARCHLPGWPGTGHLATGAGLFAELGCAMCHPLESGGKGGYDFGPDLCAIGRKDSGYLKTSLINPTANFADSTMPAFARTFETDPEALNDLLTFLHSLALPRSFSSGRLGHSQGLLAEPCATCHAGPAGRAAGRFEHRCAWIRDRRPELACARCHAQQVPAPGPNQGFCPLVNQHRTGCPICHLMDQPSP